MGSVGLLIALGAMIGGLLADSGGADLFVSSVVGRVSRTALPWAMMCVAALIGLPLFFEIGVVLLVPIVVLVAERSAVPLLKVGLPALAGLSVLHGLVPPHPGPLVAIAALHADLGLTLLFGLTIAVPTVIIAGPMFGLVISRYVQVATPTRLVPTREPAIAVARTDDGRGAVAGPADGPPPDAMAATANESGAGRGGAGRTDENRGPRLVPTVLTIALPVALMLARAIGELTLVDAGVGDLVAGVANNSQFPVLVLGWLIAVGIRLATGSATVATITAAGIVVPLAAGLTTPGNGEPAWFCSGPEGAQLVDHELGGLLSLVAGQRVVHGGVVARAFEVAHEQALPWRHVDMQQAGAGRVGSRSVGLHRWETVYLHHAGVG